jgi:hypothetical protein
MRTDGRTDMTKLMVAFRNFANAPKNIRCEIITAYSEIRTKRKCTTWTEGRIL